MSQHYTSRRSLFKALPLMFVPPFFIQNGFKLFDSLDINLDDRLIDEDFWKSIKKDYVHSEKIMNLNSGGVNPQPIPVQKVHEEFLRFSNEVPTLNMWRVLEKNRENIREQLAELGGCNPEEIAINRNATESLDSIISGIQLNKGDEVVLSRYDYPRMLAQWRRREAQEGIILKYAELKVPMENKSEIIEAYTSQFTSKTKVVLITHIINWSGQVIPVKEIATEAKSRNIEVIVDGAHSFAHLTQRIDDMNCDYYGASLHKWLGAPFGTGLLYIRKEKIKNIPPLFYSDFQPDDNIRKFEELGTRNNAAEFAISAALEYHQKIGTKRKGDRLLFLRDYWANQLENMKRVKILHPQNKELSCGLGLLAIQGMSGTEIYSQLLSENIVTSPVVHEDIDGVRVTPNIFTQLSDLDFFVSVVRKMI